MSIETLRRLYDAFEARDIDALRDLLADCVWHIPGDNPLAGAHRGAEEIVAVFGRAREISAGTLAIHVRDVLGDDEHVVGLDRVTATRDGRSLDMNRVVIGHADGGRLREVWIVPEDQYAFDEFWS